MLIRLGSHDQPVHPFHAPAVTDELIRQPVQQLGMGGALAHQAEVAGRGHDPPAEMVLPDAVRHDAAGEGIFGASQPIRQRGPASRRFQSFGGRILGRRRIENREESRLHFFTGRGIVGHRENVGRGRLLAEVPHADADWDFTGMHVLEAF